jgi:hypothetical protein
MRLFVLGGHFSEAFQRDDRAADSSKHNELFLAESTDTAQALNLKRAAPTTNKLQQIVAGIEWPCRLLRIFPEKCSSTGEENKNSLTDMFPSLWDVNVYTCHDLIDKTHWQEAGESRQEVEGHRKCYDWLALIETAPNEERGLSVRDFKRFYCFDTIV